MPWKTETPMEQLQQFVSMAQSDRFTLTELCLQFGISRKTAYKHLERYVTGGMKALAVRTSRPGHSPARTAEAITELILAERRLHRTWGPGERMGSGRANGVRTLDAIF